jgi:hypothetical protein
MVTNSQFQNIFKKGISWLKVKTKGDFLMQSRFIFYLIITLISFINCNNRGMQNAPDLFTDTITYFKIYENKQQDIKLNGYKISLNDLDEKLKTLKNGLILYSCVGATENPPECSQIIDLLKKYKIPLKMFTDSTFNNHSTNEITTDA